MKYASRRDSYCYRCHNIYDQSKKERKIFTPFIESEFLRCWSEGNGHGLHFSDPDRETHDGQHQYGRQSHGQYHCHHAARPGARKMFKAEGYRHLPPNRTQTAALPVKSHRLTLCKQPHYCYSGQRGCKRQRLLEIRVRHLTFGSRRHKTAKTARLTRK